MIKRIGLLVMVGIIGSCGKNECSVNCALIFPELYFKIVNSAGTNLVCGPGKIYNLSDIKVRSNVANVLVTDSITLNGDASNSQTAIALITNNLSAKYLIYVNNIKTDSFQCSYQTLPAQDCCPQYNTITQVNLNNVATAYKYPGNTAPVNVVK
jgi:hypothetical protein